MTTMSVMGAAGLFGLLLAPGLSFAPPKAAFPCRWSVLRAVTKPDAAMVPTYDALADIVCARLEDIPEGQQWWCGIAGGPGSGKSTLAEAVAQRVEQRGVPSVVLPLDGFHYSKENLRRLDPPDAPAFLPRRGAPFTFDAEGFVQAMTQARETKQALLPTYCRVQSDPVPGGAKLGTHHRAVFVEGNYLLLGLLADDSDLQVAMEAQRWAPLLPLFDDTWFISPKGGVPEQRRRLIARHLETWTDAKTALFNATTPEEGAAKRTDANDVINAHLVDKCRGKAERHITSVSDTSKRN